MIVQHNEDLSRVMNNIRIELYETGFADLDSEWRQQDVCSPFSRLYYVISGKGFLRIHSEKEAVEELHELKPGYVYLIPNGCSYDYFCDDKLEKVYMHINVLLQNRLELFSGCKTYYKLPIEAEHLKKLKQWMQGRSPEDFFSTAGRGISRCGSIYQRSRCGRESEQTILRFSNQIVCNSVWYEDVRIHSGNCSIVKLV